MGALPWPLTDDSTVRHLVLNKDMRPELRPSNLVSGYLINLIHLSWDRVPSNRPSFETIARELKKHCQRASGAMFAPPPPQEETKAHIFRAPAGADVPIIACKGATFPPTEKSDRNMDMVPAWRCITSHPDFKNVDMDELCSEFTDKARYDGTKVVLDPQGITSILDKLSTRLNSSP